MTNAVLIWLAVAFAAVGGMDWAAYEARKSCDAVGAVSLRGEVYVCKRATQPQGKQEGGK